MDQQKQPIGRYILLAISFVVIFVITGFIAFRFINRGSPSQSVATTTTSPTPGVANQGTVTVANYRTLLPERANPTLPKIQTSTVQATLDRLNRSALRQNVTRDEQGRLLINGLVHEERFALEEQRIIKEREIELAKERTRGELELAKLQLAGVAEETKRQKQAGEVQLASAKANLQATLYSRQLDYQVELARLETQALIERNRLATQLRLASLNRSVSTQPVTSNWGYWAS